MPQNLPNRSQWFTRRNRDGSDEGLDDDLEIFFVESCSYSTRVER